MAETKSPEENPVEKSDQSNDEDDFGSEFEFDDSDMEVDEDELDRIDESFIQSIKEKSEKQKEDDSSDAYLFWLLVVVLMVFVFIIGALAFKYYKFKKGSVKVSESDRKKSLIYQLRL
jgi:hypothetical protein